MVLRGACCTRISTNSWEETREYDEAKSALLPGNSFGNGPANVLSWSIKWKITSVLLFYTRFLSRLVPPLIPYRGWYRSYTNDFCSTCRLARNNETLSNLLHLIRGRNRACWAVYTVYLGSLLVNLLIRDLSFWKDRNVYWILGILCISFVSQFLGKQKAGKTFDFSNITAVQEINSI